MLWISSGSITLDKTAGGPGMRAVSWIMGILLV
jgi:hypothetical protein